MKAVKVVEAMDISMRVELLKHVHYKLLNKSISMQKALKHHELETLR